jgi:predicted SAM-dependent methyltransferase
MKLDIGCGKWKKDGFVGIDILSDVGADIVCDVTVGLPIKDNVVDEIYCSHFLEHIEFDQVVALLNEFYRVCTNTARIEIKVPLNFEDPSHQYLVSYGWINDVLTIMYPKFYLFEYSIDTIHTESILPHEYGKKFSYQQATVVIIADKHEAV